MKTRQEWFNHICKQIVAQGKPSIEDGVDSLVCVYRGQGGTKCAAGHLISDEHYYPELEGENACETVVADALEASLGVELSNKDIKFIGAMQRAHDIWASNLDFLVGFKQKARNVGGDFNLILPSCIQS